MRRRTRERGEPTKVLDRAAKPIVIQRLIDRMPSELVTFADKLQVSNDCCSLRSVKYCESIFGLFAPRSFAVSSRVYLLIARLVVQPVTQTEYRVCLLK
jgi:hypothetical protein